MRSLSEAALHYASIGWPIFPCHPKGKVPLILKWQVDRPIDLNEVDRWWRVWPDANIALVTGKRSGIVAIDVDPRHYGDDSMRDLEREHGRLPDTVTSCTGGGGYHYLFRYVEGFRNTASEIAQGIDTRGDGGFIIIPPSVHANGRTYEWEGSGDPEEVAIAELPDWLRPGLKQTPTTGNLGLFVAGKVPHDGAPVKPGGRNNALASMAGQWVQAGHDVRTVIALAKDWNSTCPVPLSEAEVEHTCASIALTHARNNPASMIRIGPDPTEEIQDNDWIDKVDTAVDGPDNVPEAAIIGPQPVPSDLLHPPGALGDMVRWIVRSAWLPQPELALGNTIAFAGAVLGRKVCTETDLRTNLYVLGIAASGSGKDHSRKCIKRLTAEIGITDRLLGGEDVTSDSALHEAVVSKPSILFLWDEIGHMVASHTSKYAAAHVRNIPMVLTQFFSSASGTKLGKEYAGRGQKPRQDIDQPNVCLYGTTVPETLAKGLTPSEIGDGFVARMLMFQVANNDPLPQIASEIDRAIPESVIEWVKEWMNRVQDRMPGNIAAEWTNKPTVVPFHGDSLRMFHQFSLDCRDRRISERSTQAGLEAIWTRANEHAMKLALIAACSKSTDPKIDDECATYGIRLATYLTESLLKWARNSIAENDQQRSLFRVLGIIRRHPWGITAAKLTRSTQWLSKRDRENILNDLLESQQVMARTIPTKTKATRVYAPAKNWGDA